MFQTTRKTTSADRFNFYFKCPKRVHEDGIKAICLKKERNNRKMSLNLFQVFVPLLLLLLL